MAPAGAPPADTATPTPSVAPVPQADPVPLDIPAIGVSSELLQLGLQEDGTLEVPPFEAGSKAGWYRNGPAPGEIGPAVAVGHVDSAKYGPAVFVKLGALQPSDGVDMTRADGSVAVFRVDRSPSIPRTTSRPSRSTATPMTRSCG